MKKIEDLCRFFCGVLSKTLKRTHSWLDMRMTYIKLLLSLDYDSNKIFNTKRTFTNSWKMCYVNIFIVICHYFNVCDTKIGNFTDFRLPRSQRQTFLFYGLVPIGSKQAIFMNNVHNVKHFHLSLGDWSPPCNVANWVS